jgi:hypothetical protein
VVSGHLGSPSVNDSIVTEEEDSSVTSLEASVGLLLDCYSSVPGTKTTIVHGDSLGSLAF